MTNEERLATITPLGLEYSAEFVPQSKSRNAGEKSPSLNWRVTLKRNGVEIVTDYSQGIAHMPGYKQFLSIDQQAKRETAAERGVTSYLPGSVIDSRKKIPAPSILDVLYCLTSDSDAIDYPFDEWCANSGYDTDSRKAEATYRQCLEIAIKLRRMVGDEGLHTLREVFADY